ncbi:MAG: hypothetical protein CME34_22775 [Gordonia sp.]|uniref:hypothetical protein n=1 Tax=Gordonia sp. (in: high G+C Gram-positive bacteria) TaxID=84139 RepID=UPI000C4150AC|nr:hypothetical protein [Gordonia sp. (in: high G+C Gram-positive bacteria)]MAU84636.1 hypothetical protein [Gordonia sp. (in: high G+C Gram-positive bacteria)]
MNAWLADQDRTAIEALADRIAERDPDRLARAGDDRHFAVWMLLVDRKARNYSGHAVTDLPDWAWRDAYDDDLSPHDAFSDALAHWVDIEGL